MKTRLQPGARDDARAFGPGEPLVEAELEGVRGGQSDAASALWYLSFPAAPRPDRGWLLTAPQPPRVPSL
jgi:hypothetical protein